MVVMMWSILLVTTLSAQLPDVPVPDPCLDVAFYAGAAAEARLDGTPWQAVHARDIVAAKGDKVELRRRMLGLMQGYSSSDQPDEIAYRTYMLCLSGKLKP